MNQGARIIDGNIDALSNADMQIITADDFNVEVSVKQKKTVGFAI